VILKKRNGGGFLILITDSICINRKGIMKHITLILVLLIYTFAQTPTERKSKMSEPTAFALTKVAQISVRVTNIDRATEFYQSKLGLQHLHKAPSVSIFDCGGVTLLLSLPEKDSDNGCSVIYFDVAEIQSAFTTLSSRGVQFVGKPHIVGKLGKLDVWVAVFRDSENNMMGLRSLVPTA
jgi:predicted enzyme related to lactoylglutathione lyase